MQMQATRPVAASRPTTRPEFAAILGRVRKLRPEIEARALATAKAKRVSAETMEALREADVFRMMQPARFGGFEYGPAELAQIGFELGRACGSTGWCGTLAVCFGWMTAFFPLEAQQEVWDNPDTFWPCRTRPVRTSSRSTAGIRSQAIGLGPAASTVPHG